MIVYFLYLLMRVVVMFVLWYVVVMAGVGVLQMLYALYLAPRHVAREKSFEYQTTGASGNVPPISLIVPAYNKKDDIVESIKLMLNLNYLNYEIVVVNDGSTDGTLDTVINAFSLHKTTYPIREQLATKKIQGVYYNPDIPRLRLVDKENGGKSDTLNAGINFSRFPYFVSIDPDSRLAANALVHIGMAFMHNKYTVSVGGIIRISNDYGIDDGKGGSLSENIWVRFQMLEYFRSFLVARIGWNSINSMLIVNNSFGAFQKSVVIQVGGYSPGVAGQDMDLVIKLHQYMRKKKYKYRVSFLPYPIWWTVVPDNLASLFRQRRRWQSGLLDTFGRHPEMLLKPRYGIPGMLAMPYHFLAEVVTPCIELLGYIAIPLAWNFGFLSLESMVLFFTASLGFGMITSLGALVVEDFTHPKFLTMKDSLRLSFLSIVENLFYRQLTLVFRLASMLLYRKYKQEGLKRRMA